jgi:hypothetical protein
MLTSRCSEKSNCAICAPSLGGVPLTAPTPLYRVPWRSYSKGQLRHNCANPLPKLRPRFETSGAQPSQPAGGRPGDPKTAARRASARQDSIPSGAIGLAVLFAETSVLTLFVYRPERAKTRRNGDFGTEN